MSSTSQIVQVSNRCIVGTKSQCVCQWCLTAITPTQETYKSWSVHSPDCALFGSLLSGAGPVIGQLLDDIIPMLTSCLSPDTDPEMRLQYVLKWCICFSYTTMGAAVHTMLYT